MVLLSANDAVGAEMHEAAIVLGQEILHVPPVGGAESASPGLLKRGDARMHPAIAGQVPVRRRPRVEEQVCPHIREVSDHTSAQRRAGGHTGAFGYPAEIRQQPLARSEE